MTAPAPPLVAPVKPQAPKRRPGQRRFTGRVIGRMIAGLVIALIFKYKSSLGPGVASALSVVNFLVCLVIIGIYLIVVKPTKER